MLQSFDGEGISAGHSVLLDQAGAATYEAELLFNLDLNGDGVRGRNIQSVDEGEHHRAGGLDVFKGGNELGLQQDVNSQELYVSGGGERTLLRNGEGSGYVLGGGEEAVAVEADGSGVIHLLSWDGARKGFNLQLFGADGELSGGAIELSDGDLSLIHI